MFLLFNITLIMLLYFSFWTLRHVSLRPQFGSITYCKQNTTDEISKDLYLCLDSIALKPVSPLTTEFPLGITCSFWCSLSCFKHLIKAASSSWCFSVQNTVLLLLLLKICIKRAWVQSAEFTSETFWDFWEFHNSA